MADVSQRRAGRRDRPHPEIKGRGQLILVTALSLAILFVALALILNTAIYTENLATRSGDIGGATDAVRYHDAARDGVGGVIGYANAHNNTSHATLQANLSTGVEGFRNNSARLFASGDRAVEVTLDDSVDGTRIAQSDENRNFTNTSGTGANWTVVTQVSHTRDFEINITDETTLASPDSEFRVKLTDGSGATWFLNITPSTEVEIRNASGGTVTCAAPTSNPIIDVTAGTVGGEACDGFVFADGLSTPYDIAFQNADNIQGTYSMVVDNETLATTVEGPYPHLQEDGSGQPFAAHAIYSANVTVVYETSRLYYNTTVRVAPGETDG